MTKFGLLFIPLIFLVVVIFYVLEPRISLSELMPAPGCGKKIPFVFGVCYGKNKIKDLEITGDKPDCLKIRANNCQVAQLEIENTCANIFHFTINDEGFNKKFTYLRYMVDEFGEITRREKGDKTYPEKDYEIELIGKIGENNFKINYVETKALCD